MMSDAHRPAVELVVLLASAGGLDALSVVLRDLPGEFGAAVVVQQHLGGSSSVLPTILGRSTAHRVSWAVDGQVPAPGEVVVCPPDMHMELRPDGSCWLHKMQALGERRFDVLLASVAASFGARGLAVVLSGSGRDGAVGTAAMKKAGAIVIAQSPDTAKYTSMPIAAADAGADLVLPIHDIGHVLGDVVAGTLLAWPPRATDWCATTLRPSIECRPDASDRNATGSPGERMEKSDTAPDESRTWPAPEHAVNTPASRAEAARLRAAELRRRRQDLAAGRGADEQIVAIARQRARQSLRRAQLAQQAAAQAAAQWGGGSPRSGPHLAQNLRE